MLVTLNLDQLSKLCISLPYKLETSPFTSQAASHMVFHLHLPSFRSCGGNPIKHALQRCQCCVKAIRFCLQRRGWHVSTKRCVSCEQDKRARRPFCYQSHKTRLLETWVSKDLKDFPGKACGMTTPPTTTRNHAKASSIEKYTSLSSRGGSLQTPANQAGCHPVVGHWNYL